MSYPSHLDFIRARYGTKWCVAQRLTDRLRSIGYNCVISPAKYKAEYSEWAAGHPAMLLVETLPDGPEKELIRKAVRHELGAS